MSAEIKKSFKKDWTGAAVDVSVDASGYLEGIEKVLGDLKEKSPNTLRNAVNATARKMRTRMANQAAKTYALSETARSGGEKINYKDALVMRKATVSSLTARLRVSAKGDSKYLIRNALSKFVVTPDEYSYGKSGPPHYKANVLRGGTPKVMQKGNLKSFLVEFSSGHKALVRRNPAYTYDDPSERIKKWGIGADLTRIEEQKGPSVSEMLGSQRVYGVIEPKMGSLLQQEVERFVEKTIQREAAKKK